ncbi:MAG: hypothetical protein IPP77_09555 [Bacteroidetes bacterium]|nr:hypothetical protein [Bacteroidota bacterium]
MMESIYPIFKDRTKSLLSMILFLIGTLLLGKVNAQVLERKIEWSESSKSFRTLDEKNIVQPTFTDATHLEEFGLLPVYAEMIPMSAYGTVSAQLLNPVYAPAGSLDKESLTFIKDSIAVKADWSYHQKVSSVYLSLLPFRKNPLTGTIEKLVSFNLQINVKAKPEKRSTRSYAANSVLASGNWYKVSVMTEGIYKIDYDFIRTKLNIDPSSFNLNTLAVFGNGGGMVPDYNSVDRPDDLIENSTMVVDNNGNNKFDADDYLLFFGQIPDSWTWNAATQLFEHKKNLYSTQTFYFLTTDAGTGKRVTPSSTEEARI